MSEARYRSRVVSRRSRVALSRCRVDVSNGHDGCGGVDHEDVGRASNRDSDRWLSPDVLQGLAVLDRCGDDNGSRQVGTLAMLPLPPAARLLATHTVLAIMFDHLNAARRAGFGEPNREPTATDSERR
jgi:hypothetical protein